MERLHAPDILVLQEIQDNSGAVDDGVVDASLTYSTLITAIQAAGGPVYEYRDIPPLNNQDGGELGGNIRVGFLFHGDNGVSFIDRPGGDAITPVQAQMGAGGIQLSISPGRIQPTDPAFEDSRKPLVGEFQVNGEALFVVGNHLVSRSGDDPLFGRYQPPVLSSESKRLQQASIIQGFTSQILALDPEADVVVLGDLNDFPFSPVLSTLAGSTLHSLILRLPVAERYTYIYDGNGEAIDHILVSDHLDTRTCPQIDIVHVNAEFLPAERASDHDPLLSRLMVGGGSVCRQVYLPLAAR